MNLNIALVQLLRERPDDPAALTPEGMKTISAYAAGIGPSIRLIVDPDSTAANLKITNLVEIAHDLGMVVHPYTFRRDRLPAYVAGYDELLKIFLDEIGVDGVFTDFPDLTVESIESRL